MYDCKHIRKKRWYHEVFGRPSLYVDEVDAKNELVAEKKFRLKGHHFGMFH
jgi:hypothetical protein